MSWIAGYVLLSIAVCLLTVAAHDIVAWLANPPWLRDGRPAVVTWTKVYPNELHDRGDHEP